jgi:hypothetical protein
MDVALEAIDQMAFQLDDFIDRCDLALAGGDAGGARPTHCPRCQASPVSLVADGTGIFCLVCGGVTDAPSGYSEERPAGSE